MRKKIRDLALFFRQHQTIIFLLLAIVGSCFILFPYHNFQITLTQGDTGRGLYAFRETMKGALPYRDYYWPYGPLMPYFYATIFKIFGVSINHAWLALLFLRIVCAVIFYLTLSLFTSPFFALIGSLWFQIFQRFFGYTYNHIGVIICLLLITYFSLLYLRNYKKTAVYLCFLFLFFIFLIKINFGFTSLVALLMCLLAIDKFHQGHRLKTYGKCLLVLVIAVFSCYFFLLYDLPSYVIQQSLPLSSSHHGGSHHWTIFEPFQQWTQGIINAFKMSWTLTIPSSFFIFFFFQAFLPIKKLKEKNKIEIILALSIVSVLGISAFHEYFLGRYFYGELYASPLLMLFLIIVLGIGFKKSPKILRVLMIVSMITAFLPFVLHARTVIRIFKQPQSKFQDTFANIYAPNPPVWFYVVRNTTSFLRNNLNKDELFFAFPGEPIYYFLTDKSSPVRELYFMSFTNITPDQEKAIIETLENKKVNWVIRSNIDPWSLDKRNEATNYCQILKNYIDDNFFPVRIFGEWREKALSGGTRAIMILRRISDPALQIFDHDLF